MGLVCGVVALVAARPLHDFHFSRTDVHWNRETQTLQATARVFTDDLELAIRHHAELGEDHPIWLGDDQEWNGADSAIATWLDRSLILHVDDALVELTWVGKEVELDVEVSDTIVRIKERMEEKEGIPPVQQRLIFGGKQMHDEKTAKDYNIEGGSVIHMVLALRGGGGW